MVLPAIADDLPNSIRNFSEAKRLAARCGAGRPWCRSGRWPAMRASRR